MKKIGKHRIINDIVAFTIAIAAIVVISSCGTTSVTHDEAYQAGYTIGRLLNGD